MRRLVVFAIYQNVLGKYDSVFQENTSFSHSWPVVHVFIMDSSGR